MESILYKKTENDYILENNLGFNEINLSKNQISHELKTPINSILGLSELLLRTDLDLEQRDYVEKIKTYSNSLIHMINKFVLQDPYSAFNSLKKFNLTEIINEIKSMITILLFDKKVEFILENNLKDLDFLYGNKEVLKQVLLNLLSNSVKYTEQGYIKLKINEYERENNKTVLFFEIEDTGTGIEKSLVDSIYMPFVKGNEEGTGFGLHICKELAKFVKGDVFLNHTDSYGTSFIFKGEFTVCENYYFTNFLENINILVADDNEIDLIIMKEILEAEKAKVTILNNSSEVLKRALDFDLVIMDINMSPIDGITITEILRKNGMEIPIILVSAYSESEIENKTKNAGINGFVSKPLEPEKLYRCIKKVALDN